jgi:acyl-CoA-dependent ceramide synthase
MSSDPVMQVEDKIVPGPSVTSEKPVAEERIILQEATVIRTTEDELHAASNGSASVATSPTTGAPSRPRLKKDNSTPNMNGPLYMQTAGNKTVLVRRLKRKEESTWKHLSRWFVENQIGLSFNLLALIFLAQTFIPKARDYTQKFFHLSSFSYNHNG